MASISGELVRPKSAAAFPCCDAIEDLKFLAFAMLVR
jgi:hypothetical protein